MYACETWTIKKTDKDKILAFKISYTIKRCVCTFAPSWT